MNPQQNQNEPQTVQAAPSQPFVGSAVSTTGALDNGTSLEAPIINDDYAQTEQRIADELHKRARAKQRRRLIRYTTILGAILLTLSIGAVIVSKQQSHNATLNSVGQRFNTVNLPASELPSNTTIGGGGTVSINGQLNVNSPLVLAPMVQPSSAVSGQLYFDQSTKQLSFYNGTNYQTLANTSAVVSSLGGKTGAIGLGNSLAIVNGQLSYTGQAGGVTSLQGQTGTVTLVGGSGIGIAGTTVSNKGVLSIGSSTGAISLGSGLSIAGNVLSVSGLASSNAVVSSLGGATGTIGLGGNLAIVNGQLSYTGAVGGTGNVSTGGGTTGTLPVFSGSDTLADSLVSQGAGGVSINGNLTVSGSLSLGTVISVGNGGTGNNSLASNQLLVGNGASAVGSVTNGSAGQCLVANASGAPSFQTCTGAGGVSSVNGQSGSLTLNGTANQINISNAGGTFTLSTPQNIDTSANVSFGSVSAGSLSGNGASVTNVNAAALNGQSGSYYTNASNITTGTLSNTQLSASVTLQGNTFNGANQLLQLNASGQLPAVNGSLLTNVNAAQLNGQAGSYYTNASNIGSGTLSDNRLSGNVALLNAASNNFTGATLQHNGNNVCDTSGNCTGVAGGSVGGSGAANTIAMFTGSGYTIGNSLLSQDAGATTVSVGGALSVTGAVTAGSFSGNGAAVTNVNAAQLGGQAGSYYTNAGNIATGTLNDGRLSSNVPLLNGASNNFTGATLQHNGNNICDASGNCTGVAGGAIGGSGAANTIAMFTGSGYTIGNSLLSQDSGATTVTIGGALSVSGAVTAASLSGNGSGVTNVNAAQLSGQAGSYYTNATNISSGTLSNARLSASVTLQGNTFNGANQLLQLDGSGFLPAVNGSAVTNLNGSNIATGTVANARLIGSGSLNVNSGTGLSGGGAVALGGTTTLSVVYGAAAGNAVQGNTTLVCPTTSGNLSGSGNTITLGSGGNCGAISMTTTPSFTNVTLGDTTTNTGQVILHDGATAFTGTVQLSGSLSANQTYKLPTTGGTVCVLEAGNCTGSSSGAVTASGTHTTNQLAKFDATGNAITNSIISDNGSTATIAGALSVTGGVTFSALPSSGSQCLTTDASGVLSLVSCLSGSGGGAGGVASLNGLSGTLSINNATTSGGNTIIINDAKADGSTKGIAAFTSANFKDAAGVIDTIQGIATSSTPTFAGLTLSGSNFSTNGIVTSVSGSLSSGTINLGTSSYITGTLGVGNGGTGLSSLTANQLLYAASSSSVGQLANGSAGQCLVANASGAPSFQTCTGAGGVSSINSQSGAITLNGTTNQVSVSNTGGTFTLSTPQNIDTSAAVNFNTINASTLVQTNGTTRIDATGNLSNIGTITTSGLITGGNGLTISSGNITLNNLTGGASSCLTLNGSNQVGVATCATGSSSSPTLQNVYDNSSTTPVINLSSTGKGLVIQDAATTVGGNLFAVRNNGNTTTYFAVTTAGATVSGTVTATAFSGDGTAVTNVNAAQLNGQAGSYYTNASNISTGTLSDSRLSTNVALLNGSNNFTGSTLQHNGNNICDASNNCNYLTTSAAATGYVQFAPATAQANSSANSAIFLNNTGSATKLVELQNGASDVFTVSNTGAVAATSFAGDGSALTNINASNIASGTVSDSRLSTNVPLLNGASNNFTGTTLQHNGSNVCDASNNCNYLTTGSASTNYVQFAPSAAQVNSSANSALFINNTGSATKLVDLQSGGSDVFSVSNTGAVTATSFSGDGTNVTNVNAALLNGQAGSYYTNASNITSGTLSNARLSANVTLQGNTFNGANQLLQLSASGYVSTTLLNGAYGSVTGTGALASGSITTGFGNILTTNSIQGASLTATGAVTSGTTSAAGSIVLKDGTANTRSVTLTVAAQTVGSGTITVPDIAGATNVNFCLSTGNCTAAGTAGGDLSGSYPSPKVVGIQGTPVTISGLATGQILNYNGTAWINTSNPNIAGTLTANTLTATSVANISNGSTNAYLGVTGTAAIRPKTDSTSLFAVQNTSGTALFNIDSQNSKTTISTNTLQVSSPTVNIGAAVASGTGFSTQKLSTSCVNSAVVSADFNGDGKADLAYVACNSNYVQVNLNTATGFATASIYGTGTLYTASGLTTADVNGDGKPDLVAITETASNVYAISVLLNNGDGTFATAVTYPFAYTPSPSIGNNIMSGDFNGDGKADLAISTTSGLVILDGNGDGTFGSPTLYSAVTGMLQQIADLNGDSKPDILTTTSNGFAVVLNNGDGTFAAPVSYTTASSSVSRVAVGDFNGDGKADLALFSPSSSASYISILSGNGDGTFGGASLYPTGSNQNSLGQDSLVAAKFNTDSKYDLALGASGVTVYLRNTQTIGSTSGSVNIGGSSTSIGLLVQGGGPNGNSDPNIFQAQDIQGIARLVVTSGGNVGIGSASASYPLDVTGDINTSTEYRIAGNVVLQSPGANGTSLYLGNTSAASLTSGSYNYALGYGSLYADTTGSYNVGIGPNALRSNSSGNYNLAASTSSLGSNTTGTGNTALGYNSLFANTTGSYNSALGYSAGSQDSSTRFSTIATLQNSTAIGAYAQVQKNNTIALGSVDNSTQVVIGATEGVGTNSFGVSPADLKSASITASQSSGSGTITASSGTFSANNVGEEFIWADGTVETITGFTDSTHVTGSSTTINETNSYFRTHVIGFQVTNTGTAYVRNGSTTAFQVQSATGTSILNVDATTGHLTLSGTASGSNAVNSNDFTTLSQVNGIVTSGISGSAANYIQNSQTLGANQNFFIQGVSNSVTASVQGATGTGDILDVLNSGGTQVASISSTGNTIFKASTNATSAFQIQNSTGSTVLNADTTNGRIGINTTSAAYALDVNGDINSNTAVRIGGVIVCTVSSCTPAAGSNNYIQNSTGVQVSANFNIRSTATNAVTGVLQGANGQTADLLDLQSWNGTSTTNVASVDASGNINTVGYYKQAGNTVIDTLTGTSNTFVGVTAGNQTSTGNSNVAVGSRALQVNTSGGGNVAVGQQALVSNTSGTSNVAIGNYALERNTTGSSNIGIGNSAGWIDSNLHFSTLATLQSAAAIGDHAQVQANNTIVLGSVDNLTHVVIGATEGIGLDVFGVSPLDYQGGTATRTNGSATLVGTGTTWTSAMVGDTIIFADGTTNTVTGFTDTTHITMGTAYGGTTDASPVYYRFHHVGLQVTNTGTAYVNANSTSAFQIQGTNTGTGATFNLLSADTTNQTVNIASAGSNAALSVTSSATPSGSNGVITANSTSGTGTDKLLSLQKSGVAQFTVDANGNVIALGSLKTGTTGQFQVDLSGNLQTSGTATVGSLLTANGGVTIATAKNYVNAGSTLNSSIPVSLSASGPIGANTATVDVATTIDITATAGSLSFTIPSPTVTTSGRLLYINNVGANSFTLGSVTLNSGTSASFIWNGSAWNPSAVSTGVSIIGTFSLSSQPNGASISGNTITFGAASATGVGMVSTSTQTFAGAKTIAVTSTNAFAVTDASNNAYLNVDTSTAGGVITLGNGANNVTFKAGGYTVSGTYQTTKNIALTAEYAGAVLDATSDASCSSANAGIMTSGYSGDASPRQNYYAWTSGSASTNCYDVVVQVPIPADYSSMASAPTLFLSDSTSSSSAVCMQILSANGTTDSNYSSYQCATAGTTLTSTSFPALGSTYTAGSYMTVKIRMNSTSTTDVVKVGNLNFSYKSNQ